MSEDTQQSNHVKLKKTFIRKAFDDSQDVDDETVIIKKFKSNNEANDIIEPTVDSDILERDAFVARLIERDEMKTKKLLGTSTENSGLSSSQIQELATKGKISTIVNDDSGKGFNSSTIEQLREISRQHYLEKREAKEIKILDIAMKEEEELFQGIKLSKEEIKRRELNKRILDLAKDRERFTYKDDGYQMPDTYEDERGRVDKEKRESVLTARYQEDEIVKSEQETWEEEQTKLSHIQFGAKDRKKRADNDKYQLVMDDQIDFISQAILKGTRKENEIYKGEESDDEYEREKATKLTEHEKILLGRKKLPIYSYREEFLAAVRDNKVLIVVGETGSGKTTQIPQYLHEAEWSKIGKIGCTQPRRVAAMSVAARVAQELNVKLGQEVGYSIRFEDCTSDSTFLKYMTDGMLLREFLTEPDLGSYSVMMIDEAHERTLHTDVLFGLVKDIARFRDDDFRLIISSATLDAEKFSAYFDDASIFMIPGRMFPVDIFYTKAPEADYLDAVVVSILQIHVTQEGDGDILVFLTGQEEIETATEILQKRTKGLGSRIRELMICPIYSNLPSELQAKIFEKPPEGGRKVVLGTNIAETSLTIDGICYVIDAGLCKQKTYNPRTGMESLIVTPVSKAAANQRAGRAGKIPYFYSKIFVFQLILIRENSTW